MKGVNCLAVIAKTSAPRETVSSTAMFAGEATPQGLGERKKNVNRPEKVRLHLRKDNGLCTKWCKVNFRHFLIELERYGIEIVLASLKPA